MDHGESEYVLIGPSISVGSKVTGSFTCEKLKNAESFNGMALDGKPSISRVVWVIGGGFSSQPDGMDLGESEYVLIGPPISVGSKATGSFTCVKRKNAVSLNWMALDRKSPISRVVWVIGGGFS